MNKFQGILLALLPVLICSGDADYALSYTCCIYKDWEAWSQCHKTCFGQRERYRSVWPPTRDSCINCGSNRETETCNKICQNGGTLSPSGYSCSCVTGYRGTCCSTRINCGSVGSIANGDVSCSSIYYGGTCMYVCNQYYHLTSGSWNRTCLLNGIWSGTKPYCSHINECLESPCLNGGTCANTPGSYTCDCSPEWIGPRCEIDYNECVDSSVCKNGGRCINTEGGFTCKCPQGWTGPTCELDLNECLPVNPCLNNGLCENLLGFYQCSCPPGFTGTNCESDINECRFNPCNFGGTCVNNVGSYFCNCPPRRSECDIDVQPPSMYDCPPSFKVNATKMTKYVKWNVPTFDDPMGKQIKVVANYYSPDYTFPWGDFTVQYVATKPSNGLQTECQFTISVRPTPCEELNIPANGARVCNGWRQDFGLYCLVACQSGYTIDNSQYSYSTMYVCGASGQWIASDPAPDCNIKMVDTADILQIQPLYAIYSYNSSCNDPMAKSQLQHMYIDTINQAGNFKEICSRYQEQCQPENVEVDC